MSRPVRIGTRGSALALRQTDLIRNQLSPDTPTEIVEIRTTGDEMHDVRLSGLEGSAFFTRELDEALLDGRIDAAVHSLKDLPTLLPDGIAIAAVSPREDARDALVGRGTLRWTDLPVGAMVATSSVRRQAQMLYRRPDLDVVEIRGNVDKRLATLDATPGWAATVLAVAGLLRLDLAHRIGERLPDEVMLPAPGQGALAVTTRTDDDWVRLAVARAVDDEAAAACVRAERGLLRALEGGCQSPIGAHCRWLAGKPSGLRLSARLVAPDGSTAVEGQLDGPATGLQAATDLGVELAERLKSEGGEAILERIRAARQAHGP